MTMILGNTDCGNSPKMKFLKEFNEAFVKGNVGFLADHVTKDIYWDIVGDKKINGHLSFVEELEKMKMKLPSKLIFDKIISHGKMGAVNGSMTMKSGETYAFADMYEFSSAKGDKIKSIVSFVIKQV